MESFFEDQKALNNIQTQLEQSGLNFLVDLNDQIKGLGRNITQNNRTLGQISGKQQIMLGKIEEEIAHLKNAAVPQLVDMRDESDDKV